MDKWIYETTVDKEVEEKISEVQEQNGEKVEITKTIKRVKPVKIAILKPTRKLWESAEIFYAKQISYFIQNGLLPRSLVAKRYANDGGALSEPEKEKIKVLENQIEQLQGELFFLFEKTEDEKIKKRNELIIKINNLNIELGNIKNSYSEIFENTAEHKARNKTVEWWVLYLSHIDEDNKGYKPIFGNGTHEEKLTKYDQLEENGEPFVFECIKKLSYLISIWMSSHVQLTKIDFEAMEKLYQENISDYKVEPYKEETKIEDKSSI